MEEAIQISFGYLEKCLKPLKNGGGGWLDVQKNLWYYYITMQKNDSFNRNQRFQQQFWITKKLKPAKLIKSSYVLWYENLWRINNKKIPKTMPKFATTMVPPTIYGNLGEVPEVKVEFLSDLKTKQKETKDCVNCLLTNDNLKNETIKEMLAIILKKDMNDKSLENKNNEWLKENFEQTTNIALILGLGDKNPISTLLRRKIEKYINKNCYEKTEISNNFKKLLAKKVNNLKQQINDFLENMVATGKNNQMAIKELRTILNNSGAQALIKALEYINELTL